MFTMKSYAILIIFSLSNQIFTWELMNQYLSHSMTITPICGVDIKLCETLVLVLAVVLYRLG